MSRLNELNCATNKRNTGFGNCVFDPKLIAGALLYDNERSFTAAELTDLQATLQADAANDTKSSRMMPVHKFVALTDNTEDETLQTFDYGVKIVVKDGDYDWVFQYIDGANCLQQALRSHNGKKFVLFYDKDGTILGYQKNGLLTTIPVQFYAKNWKAASGSAVAQYMIRFIFSANYVNEDLGFVKADGFNLEDISGLQDLELVIDSFSDGGGVAVLSVMTKCGRSNVGETYNQELVSSSLWKATNQETGGDITIATVTYNATTKKYTVTLTPGDTDYPDDGVIELSLKAPSVLAAADVEGYECIPAELTVSSS
jgi:hypothetical protein